MSHFKLAMVYSVLAIPAMSCGSHQNTQDETTSLNFSETGFALTADGEHEIDCRGVWNLRFGQGDQVQSIVMKIKHQNGTAVQGFVTDKTRQRFDSAMGQCSWNDQDGKISITRELPGGKTHRFWAFLEPLVNEGELSFTLYGKGKLIGKNGDRHPLSALHRVKQTFGEIETVTESGIAIPVLFESTSQPFGLLSASSDGKSSYVFDKTETRGILQSLGSVSTGNLHDTARQQHGLKSASAHYSFSNSESVAFKPSTIQSNLTAPMLIYAQEKANSDTATTSNSGKPVLCDHALFRGFCD